MHLGAPSQPQSRIQINLPFLPSANGPISTLGSFSLWYHYHPGFQPEPRVIPPPCSCCSLHYNLSALKSFKSPVYPFCLSRVKPFLLYGNFPVSFLPSFLSSSKPSCHHLQTDLPIYYLDCITPLLQNFQASPLPKQHSQGLACHLESSTILLLLTF